MKRLSRHSWMIVIATVVLLAAATGATLARSVASNTSQITPTQVRRIARSVADAEIARLAPGLSVKSARTANSPALYAQVSGVGGVTGNSQGIVQENVSHPRPGIYCFGGLRSAPKGGVAILDALPPGASGPDQAQVGVGTFGPCPAGTQAVVGTFREGGDLVDDPFFVVFWF
jgi:hypothetical protein